MIDTREAPAPTPAMPVNGTPTPPLSRQQRRVLLKTQAQQEQTARVQALKRAAFLGQPPTRREMLEAFEILKQQHEQTVKLWGEMRQAFNHLSVQHTTLLRALMVRRVWGKAILSEVDLKRALDAIEADMRAQAATEAVAANQGSAPAAPPAVERPAQG